MFTLIVCLAVVALSAAVVLRIALAEETKPATPPPGPRVQSPSPGHEDGAPPPAPPAPPPAPPAPPPAPPAPDARTQGAGVRLATTPPRHRVRSAVLLVFLIATVGALLALAVGVALRLLVMGVRAGLG